MFIHWFLRCQCLLLSCLTCLTMSNLLWFMDLTFQVPRQLYSYSIGFYFHHQTPPQTEHHFDQGSSFFLAAAAAKSHQSCPTLCDPIDSSPPGSLIPGILQARTLEWVAISFCNAWKWTVKVKSFSRARLLATPGTAAYQASPPMGFSGQEYWSGEPLPSPSSAEAVPNDLCCQDHMRTLNTVDCYRDSSSEGNCRVTENVVMVWK